MGIRRMVLRRVVRFLRSPAGQQRVDRMRRRVDTPANRRRAELAAGRVWQRYDTPRNQRRAAELTRRLRSAGPQDRQTPPSR